MPDIFDITNAPYKHLPESEEGVYTGPCVWNFENFLRNLEDEQFDLAGLGDAA